MYINNWRRNKTCSSRINNWLLSPVVLKMTDSGLMMCNAKGAWVTAGGSRLGWMQWERALDALKARVSDYYIHTYGARPVGWIEAWSCHWAWVNGRWLVHWVVGFGNHSEWWALSAERSPYREAEATGHNNNDGMGMVTLWWCVLSTRKCIFVLYKVLIAINDNNGYVHDASMWRGGGVD